MTVVTLVPHGTKKQNKALVDDLLADLINTVCFNSSRSSSSSTPASSSTPNAFTTTSVKKRFKRLHADESPINTKSRTQLFNVNSKTSPTSNSELFFALVSEVFGKDVFAQLDVAIAIIRQKLVSVPGILVRYSNKSESYSELSVRGQVKLNRFIFSDHLPLRGVGGSVSGN